MEEAGYNCNRSPGSYCSCILVINFNNWAFPRQRGIYMTITIHLLPMFHTVPVLVRFNQTTYYVTEGVDTYAVITLEALGNPVKSFFVHVNTRDGSAVGEHHAVHSLFQYHCT